MTKEIIQIRLRNTRDRSYRITVQEGIWDGVPALLSGLAAGRSVFILTDSNVKRLYGKHLLRSLLDLGMNVLLIDFPAGEESKCERVVSVLQTQLLEHHIGRDSLVIALGGGVVGDIAGYVAATVLRGVEFIQVPTSLLAQVDSSVGGKVGIDHPLGKNLIGTFHQPSAVFIDPTVLVSLPMSEFRNGLAEIVKIATALDGDFFRFIETNRTKIRKENPSLLAKLIARSVGLKAAVVEKDEFESGVRKTLNLGHTIGHALERASGFSIKHGEGVAIGLAAESKIALRMGFLLSGEYKRVVNLLRSLKLPTAIPDIRNRNDFWSALAADKKSTGGKPRFVLPCGIGRSAIGIEVPSHLIEDVLET